MSDDDVIEFTPDAVREYLDEAIREWRRRKNAGDPYEDLFMCGCYIDAYQSVRVSLFGERL